VYKSGCDLRLQTWESWSFWLTSDICVCYPISCTSQRQMPSWIEVRLRTDTAFVNRQTNGVCTTSCVL
jgi:hypothetical protein